MDCLYYLGYYPAFFLRRVSIIFYKLLKKKKKIRNSAFHLKNETCKNRRFTRLNGDAGSSGWAWPIIYRRIFWVMKHLLPSAHINNMNYIQKFPHIHTKPYSVGHLVASTKENATEVFQLFPNYLPSQASTFIPSLNITCPLQTSLEQIWFQILNRTIFCFCFQMNSMNPR